MQVNSPNYKQDIANLKKNIRDYCLFKLLGNHSEKQKIKSQIFGWYQDFLTRVRAIKLNKGL